MFLCLVQVSPRLIQVDAVGVQIQPELITVDPTLINIAPNGVSASPTNVKASPTFIDVSPSVKVVPNSNKAPTISAGIAIKPNPDGWTVTNEVSTFVPCPALALCCRSDLETRNSTPLAARDWSQTCQRLQCTANRLGADLRSFSTFCLPASRTRD